MSQRIEQMVVETVQKCLQRYYSGASPLGCLAELLDELRSAGWASPDVRQVEQAVLKVLVGVMEREREAGLGLNSGGAD